MVLLLSLEVSSGLPTDRTAIRALLLEARCGLAGVSMARQQAGRVWLS